MLPFKLATVDTYIGIGRRTARRTARIGEGAAGRKSRTLVTANREWGGAFTGGPREAAWSDQKLPSQSS